MTNKIMITLSLTVNYCHTVVRHVLSLSVTPDFYSHTVFVRAVCTPI